MSNNLTPFPSLSGIRLSVLEDRNVARDLAFLALEQIDRHDTGADGWHTIIRVDREAGDQIPREQISEEGALPLAGVPLAVKDNIDTVALGCTAGSVLLDGVAVDEDAPLIADLRKAGATIIGKANLSEWANFRSRRSVSGWSSLGGQTLNPRHPRRTPCGSSSGSASAVAGGLVPAAIGTETDGSIICPAATQGLVGFKPTIGRVNAEGIIPISARQDTAGPIARTVTDAWILQHALEQPATETPPLRAAPLEGARIGIYPCASAGRDPHPEVRTLFAHSCERLRRAGATLVELDPVAGIEEINHAETTVLNWEFATGLERYLASRRRAAPFRTLRELVAVNTTRATETMPFFGQDIWEGILADLDSGALTEASYREACGTIDKLARQQGIDPWFEELDVVIAPANGPAWLIDTVNGDHYSGTAVPPYAQAGYPALTIPMGEVRDLPVGIGFFGPANADESLFSFALALEQLQQKTG